MRAQKQVGDFPTFPVHLAYHVHEEIACCTVTVQHAQAEDLVGLSVYNESPAFVQAHLAEFKALLDEMKTERGQEHLLLQFAPMMMDLHCTQWAIYNAASGLHEQTVGLGDFFRLHLEVIRSRQFLAEADFVYSRGELRVRESTCRGLTVTIEQRPPEPATELLLNIFTLLSEVAPYSEREKQEEGENSGDID